VDINIFTNQRDTILYTIVLKPDPVIDPV
jgi:hypothetical protein